MVDFEIVEPEPQQPPALQLALDWLAQQRAADQSALQDWQLWADIQPPTLTYLGQSNGQPLLQAAGGQPFRAGSRDSNGSLLLGLADVAIGSGVVRVGGMPRVQEQPVEASTPQQKIAILFAKTTDSTIEFWLGGDRSEPIKVTEIPRFGTPSTFSDSMNKTLSASDMELDIGVSEEEIIPISIGERNQGIYTRGVGNITISGSATVTGNPSDTSSSWAVQAVAYFGLINSATGAVATTVPPVLVGETGALNASNSVDDESSLVVGSLYREPSFLTDLGNRQIVKQTGLVGLLGALLASCSASASYTGNLSVTVKDIIAYRAYLSVTPTTAFVTIAYDVHQNGLENFLYFAVTETQITELDTVQADDWRRSLATSTVLPPPSSGNPAPDFPSSGNSCFDTYRRNYTTNVYQNRLYEVENGWFQPVVVDGSTFYLSEAVSGTTPIKVKLLVRALTDSGDSCQIGAPQPIEMEVQPLRLSLSDEVTFIAACAAKD